MQKNSIRSRDIRYIINKLGVEERKRYDYDTLEKTYMNYMSEDINDQDSIMKLVEIFKNKDVLVLVPGHSVCNEEESIKKYITDLKPIVVSVNFIHESILEDYIYISNLRRYRNLSEDTAFARKKKIIASNIKQEALENEIIVSFIRLVKCGWQHLDNSTLMLLRLLDEIDVKSIGIAGFDGYDMGGNPNYVNESLELANVRENPKILNEEISSMLCDFKCSRKNKIPVRFVTKSRFEVDLINAD